MDFSQLMTDILVNVSCKFEMYILKIAQVINETVRIAFRYVLIICLVSLRYMFKLLFRAARFTNLLIMTSNCAYSFVIPVVFSNAYNYAE